MNPFFVGIYVMPMLQTWFRWSTLSPLSRSGLIYFATPKCSAHASCIRPGCPTSAFNTPQRTFFDTLPESFDRQAYQRLTAASWKEKNARDELNAQRLDTLSWTVITVWECELSKNNRDAAIARIEAGLQAAKGKYDMDRPSPREPSIRPRTSPQAS